MALSQKAIQKNKQNKQHKRNKQLEHKSQNILSLQQTPLIKRGRIHECWIAHDPTGSSWYIIISRIIAATHTIVMVNFLVDVSCSGVEEVFMHKESDITYQDAVHKLMHITGLNLQLVEPSFVKKLILDSVQHAKSLGNLPPPEYNQLKAVFFDIDETTCDVTFELG